MKKSVLIIAGVLFLISSNGYAQTKTELQKHYEAFYNQMRLQGDVNGVINALTHLNLLSPSKERQDTLAYIYANDNQHLQALNTIGYEKVDEDSDLGVQVKAMSLKALGEPKRALEQFEILFSREANVYLAYEIADLKVQLGDIAGAMEQVNYGIANATPEMKYAFYERQQPYEVALKAAFLHLKGLITYREKPENIDAAIAIIEEALAMEPNFNLASLSKQALSSRKETPEEKK